MSSLATFMTRSSYPDLANLLYTYLSQARVERRRWRPASGACVKPNIAGHVIGRWGMNWRFNRWILRGRGPSQDRMCERLCRDSDRFRDQLHAKAGSHRGRVWSEVQSHALTGISPPDDVAKNRVRHTCDGKGQSGRAPARETQTASGNTSRRQSRLEGQAASDTSPGQVKRTKQATDVEGGSERRRRPVFLVGRPEHHFRRFLSPSIGVASDHDRWGGQDTDGSPMMRWREGEGGDRDGDKRQARYVTLDYCTEGGGIQCFFASNSWPPPPRQPGPTRASHEAQGDYLTAITFPSSAGTLVAIRTTFLRREAPVCPSSAAGEGDEGKCTRSGIEGVVIADREG
nr:hypothetical protein CFP56_21529 [Quercus suber]